MKEIDGNMARVELAAKKLENTINDIAENWVDIMFHKFHIRGHNVVVMVWEKRRETGQEWKCEGTQCAARPSHVRHTQT